MIETAIQVLPASGSDRALALSTPCGCLLAVADGAGGTGGGVAAADYVVAAICRLAQNPAQTDWFKVLCQVDDELSSHHQTRGETTAVIAYIEREHVRGASVGDSAAWLIPKDGNVVELTARQRRKPLIGSGEALPVEFETNVAGCRLLLATDGMTKYASLERISLLSRLGSVAAAVQALVEVVRLPSGAFRDDVGIVLVSI